MTMCLTIGCLGLGLLLLGLSLLAIQPAKPLER
jgi:hypothetical protein